MFNEKMYRKSGAFSKAKDEVFGTKPILKKEEVQPKTAEKPEASTEEVRIAREKWAEIQTIVSEGKPVDPDLFNEVSHLAHVAHKVVKKNNKLEADEMQEIEDTIKLIK
ncbi:MAG: hypothetical protein WC878_07615 [Candidatus Paceibacterota bacterium]|jgi:tRNA uridine 5-carbamoylmethylation protein Kti12